MYADARRLAASAFAAAVLCFSHPVLAQSTSTPEVDRMLMNITQLEAKTSPAVTKGLIRALQKQIAREGTSLASAGDDATTKALFQVYVGQLQETGWTKQVDALVQRHPEAIRDFHLTDAQAERTTALLHALGARSITSRTIKSRLEVSSGDKEAMLLEIQTGGIAKFLASHTGNESLSPQGVA